MLTLEQLKDEVAELEPQEQLELIGYITEQLKVMSISSVPLTAEQEQELQRQRQEKVAEMNALFDKVSAMTEGEFDSVEDIHRIRTERDEQIARAGR